MSEEANVKQINVLQNFSADLRSFAVNAPKAINMAEDEIKTTMTFLRERETFWKKEVERWKREVDKIGKELRMCEGRKYKEKRTPDPCSPIRMELKAAQAKFEEAKRDLANVKQWIQKVQQAVEKFQTQAKKFQQLTRDETQKAQGFLGKKYEDLETYVKK